MMLNVRYVTASCYARVMTVETVFLVSETNQNQKLFIMHKFEWFSQRPLHFGGTSISRFMECASSSLLSPKYNLIITLPATNRFAPKKSLTKMFSRNSRTNRSTNELCARAPVEKEEKWYDKTTAHFLCRTQMASSKNGTEMVESSKISLFPHINCVPKRKNARPFDCMRHICFAAGGIGNLYT